jgi:hypothetical protein
MLLITDDEPNLFLQELMIKTSKIGELERRLVAANAELKRSNDKSAAKDDDIASREREIEVMKHDC